MNQVVIFPGLVAANETCGMSMIQVSIYTDSYSFVVVPVTHENLCAKETKCQCLKESIRSLRLRL